MAVQAELGRVSCFSVVSKFRGLINATLLAYRRFISPPKKKKNPSVTVVSHLRIFLPLTTAPCSASKAFLQAEESRNWIKPYACLIDTCASLPYLWNI